MFSSSDKKLILYKAESPSGKLYFGISQESLSDRISKHLYTSKTKNTKFSKAIRKYGINNIIFTILFSDLELEEAIRLEKEFIEKYDTFKNGYNSTKGGEGAFGYKWDKEHHKIIHAKKIEKFYKNKEWLKTQSEITKKFNREHPDLSEKRIKNLIEYNKNNRYLYSEKRLSILRSEEVREKISKARGGKSFHVYNYYTKEYLFDDFSVNRCAKKLSLHQSKIRLVLQGKRNHTGGFFFKYKMEENNGNR